MCLGEVLSMTEVKEMLSEADVDKDGQLNFKGKKIIYGLKSEELRYNHNPIC